MQLPVRHHKYKYKLGTGQERLNFVGIICKDWILCYEYDQGQYPLHKHHYYPYLGHHYDNCCDLDHLQDINTSKGIDRNDGYDDDEKCYDDNHDGHIALVGSLGS